jgi:hypothetical protein
LSLLGDVNEEKKGIEYHDLPGNRSRFARLAVLFGWVEPGDIQFFYQKKPPHHVYSFDHAYFLPGGRGWTIDMLRQAAKATPFDGILSPCGITKDELNNALRFLAIVSTEAIADVVAVPPEVWNFSLAERVAVAEYLYKRRNDLLQRLN